MMHFITCHKNKIQTAIALLFWLVVWQLASIAVGYSFLLSSPLTVLKALFAFFSERAFWLSVLGSLTRIGSGFLLGVSCGIFLAMVAAKLQIIKILLSPFMLTIKSIPVASFTVLAILWLKNSSNLAVLMSFMMVLPLIYTSVLNGISLRDAKLAQMAKVFKIPPIRKIIYIDICQVLPHFVASCSVALGLCWKSGVAAEVIGITQNSIGGEIYNAKLLFSTQDVLAWTIVIIAISFAFEKIFMAILKQVSRFIKEGDKVI